MLLNKLGMHADRHLAYVYLRPGMLQEIVAHCEQACPYLVLLDDSLWVLPHPVFQLRQQCANQRDIPPELVELCFFLEEAQEILLRFDDYPHWQGLWSREPLLLHLVFKGVTVAALLFGLYLQVAYPFA